MSDKWLLRLIGFSYLFLCAGYFVLLLAAGDKAWCVLVGLVTGMTLVGLAECAHEIRKEMLS